MHRKPTGWRPILATSRFYKKQSAILKKVIIFCEVQILCVLISNYEYNFIWRFQVDRKTLHFFGFPIRKTAFVYMYLSCPLVGYFAFQ